MVNYFITPIFEEEPNVKFIFSPHKLHYGSKGECKTNFKNNMIYMFNLFKNKDQDTKKDVKIDDSVIYDFNINKDNENGYFINYTINNNEEPDYDYDVSIIKYSFKIKEYGITYFVYLISEKYFTNIKQKIQKTLIIETDYDDFEFTKESIKNRIAYEKSKTDYIFMTPLYQKDNDDDEYMCYPNNITYTTLEKAIDIYFNILQQNYKDYGKDYSLILKSEIKNRFDVQKSNIRYNNIVLIINQHKDEHTKVGSKRNKYVNIPYISYGTSEGLNFNSYLLNETLLSEYLSKELIEKIKTTPTPTFKVESIQKTNSPKANSSIIQTSNFKNLRDEETAIKIDNINSLKEREIEIKININNKAFDFLIKADDAYTKTFEIIVTKLLKSINESINKAINNKYFSLAYDLQQFKFGEHLIEYVLIILKSKGYFVNRNTGMFKSEDYIHVFWDKTRYDNLKKDSYPCYKKIQDSFLASFKNEEDSDSEDDDEEISEEDSDEENEDQSEPKPYFD
jgi:hypothetical protein